MPLRRELCPADPMPSAPSPIDLQMLRAALALAAFDAPSAQRLMSPEPRRSTPDAMAPRPPRTAAALLYAFRRQGRLHFPLTLRRDDLPEHRGQVSLPGGRPEVGETSWETAVREAFEEIGLAPELPVSVGALHPVYIPVTHTTLTVHVATGPEPETLEAEPREVAALGHATLDELLDPALRTRERWIYSGRELDVPSFALAGWTVWGATAIALSELAERLRATTDRGPSSDPGGI